jgi:hypothetical protein
MGFSIPAPFCSKERTMISLRAHEEFPNNKEIQYHEYAEAFMKFLNVMSEKDKQHIKHSKNVFSFVLGNWRYFAIEMFSQKNSPQYSYYGKIYIKPCQ